MGRIARTEPGDIQGAEPSRKKADGSRPDTGGRKGDIDLSGEGGEKYAGGGNVAKGKGFMPTGFGGDKGGKAPPFGGPPPGGDLTPDGGGGGRPGAKKGMPNFKARITKPGGMAKGGAVKAGQGSGIGRLARSK